MTGSKYRGSQEDSATTEMKKYGVSKVKTLQVARRKRPVQITLYIKTMHFTVISWQTSTLALPTVSVFFFLFSAAIKAAGFKSAALHALKAIIARLATTCEDTFHLAPEVPARKSCGRNLQPMLPTL